MVPHHSPTNKITFYTNLRDENCKRKVETTASKRSTKLYTDFDVDYTDERRPATFTLADDGTPEELKKLIQESGYAAEVAQATTPDNPDDEKA